MKSYGPTLVALAALLLGNGCSRSASGSSTAGRSDAVAPGHYALTGEILSVDAEKKTVRVRHEDIKGYMPGMTMDFAVSSGDVAVLKPGQRIRAEMIPSKDGGDFRLEKIWPDDKVSVDTIAAGARQLAEDTHNRGKTPYREIGESLPDFALYDQEGRVVQSGRFRGKQIMLNFIFTRCPVANMCPASTAKMIVTQRLAREAGINNIELVSMTLDPVYDTPGVLKKYASDRGIDTSNFSFLTGPGGAIRDLLAQFGVAAEFEGDIVKHTLATLLINENGKIVHRFDGSDWQPQEFVAKMKKS